MVGARVKTIGIVSKPGKSEAASLAARVRERYPAQTLLVEEHLGKLLGWSHVSGEELGWRADLVLVLGGDGTLIHAARMLKGRAVPIVGVNLGSLGFLTEITADELFPVLHAALEGTARVESRMKLGCRLYRDETLVLEDEVLNDVVMIRNAFAPMADLRTWFDGSLVTTYKADGLIFATPTGSTAYSLSAGGPIVHPSVDAVIITPISPHALTQRPIVVPGDQKLRVTLASEGSDLYLSIDGKTGVPLQFNDRLEVQKSPNRAFLVCKADRDYFAVLRQKLHWGERN